MILSVSQRGCRLNQSEACNTAGQEGRRIMRKPLFLDFGRNLGHFCKNKSINIYFVWAQFYSHLPFLRQLDSFLVETAMEKMCQMWKRMEIFPFHTKQTIHCTTCASVNNDASSILRHPWSPTASLLYCPMRLSLSKAKVKPSPLCTGWRNHSHIFTLDNLQSPWNSKGQSLGLTKSSGTLATDFKGSRI